MKTGRPPRTSTCSGTPFTSRSQLPCPVILPQRRPRKKARGFIRAYSPVLSECGISQEVFLKFLKNFHTSSQASPIFPIIRFSAAIAGLAPSVIAIAICAAAQVAASVGAEVQSRARTNDFLDRMNEELFKPAGLYCMIFKYKSDADMQQKSSSLINLIRAERVDVTTTNQTIAKYTRTTASGDGDPTRRGGYRSAYHEESYARLGLHGDRVAERRGQAYVEDERSDDAEEGSSHRALQYRDVRGRDRRNGKGGPLGAVKRIMKEDVLYLMIVNMPSESELVEATQGLARVQRH